jgi:hypothetical protein
LGVSAVRAPPWAHGCTRNTAGAHHLRGCPARSTTLTSAWLRMWAAGQRNSGSCRQCLRLHHSRHARITRSLPMMTTRTLAIASSCFCCEFATGAVLHPLDGTADIRPSRCPGVSLLHGQRHPAEVRVLGRCLVCCAMPSSVLLQTGANQCAGRCWDRSQLQCSSRSAWRAT